MGTALALLGIGMMVMPVLPNLHIAGAIVWIIGIVLMFLGK